jgi:glycosyltransferase involved in cell wall biosynthesis
MNIVMFDDSVPFDGFTAATKPLGGAEKAFAALAGALAKGGHSVTAINRCKHALMADGARWRPLDGNRPTEADVLIALRDPELLGGIRRVDTRVLWVPGDPKYLGNAHNADLLASYAPRLLFLTERQASIYGGRLSAVVAPPGVSKLFLPERKEIDPYPDANHPAILLDEPETQEEPEGPPPPHAIVTTHPLHGLTSILELWRDRIHPEKTDAKLTVYSAVLTKGLAGESVPEGIAPVLDLIKTCKTVNVDVSAPKGDRTMADSYRRSRVHLYPGHAKDFACWTLRDSQAVGVPAVARSLGGVEDVVDNGKSGFIVPDDDALVNVTLQLLSDDGVYASFHEAASAVERRTTWVTAAEAIAQMWL